ncbi:MAG: hypothetical protein ABIE23_01555 [archaeon]|nr:hypothetical protein [Candidatus Micrarchaeota archaeon]
MKLKYCPSCGSLQIKSIPIGLQCMKCKYNGEMNEDSMDKINAFLKGLKNNNGGTSTLLLKKNSFNGNNGNNGNGNNENENEAPAKLTPSQAFKERMKRLNGLSEHVEIF